MTDGIQEEILAVFKSDMETAEKMDALVDGYGAETISDASIDAAEQLLENIEQPKREKYVYATLFQVAKSIQNDKLAEFAAGKLEEWVQNHG